VARRALRSEGEDREQLGEPRAQRAVDLGVRVRLRLMLRVRAEVGVGFRVRVRVRVRFRVMAAEGAASQARPAR